MEIFEGIVQRRSVREYQGWAVPLGVLEKCAEAARVAPSAANRQVLEYILVDDDKLLPKVFDVVSIWGGVHRPKEGWPPGRRPRGYFVVLINSDVQKELGGDSRNSYFDAGMAAENIILVALEEGVGTCAITAMDRPKLARLFNLPARYEVGMMIAMGYPDETPVLEPMTGHSTARWIDDKGQRHVPKRAIEDILHRNGFP